VIVTNTTAQPIIVNGAAIFAGADDHHSIQGQIGPYQTQVVNLPHGLVKKASAGAVSLSHDGGKSALLAIIHLQDADRGYSETICSSGCLAPAKLWSSSSSTLRSRNACDDFLVGGFGL
jgi:hypothetical protein